MWILNTILKSIKAKTDVAPTTALDFTTAWFDQSGNREIGTGPNSQNGTINNTASNIIDAPAESNVSRHINIININNTDNINHSITVFFDDGAQAVIFKCLLKPGYTLEWHKKTGWRIFNEKGAPVFFLNKGTESLVTSVASSATSVTLLSENINRVKAVINNNSTRILYIKEGTTASATSYTYKLSKDDAVVIDDYVGRIDGIWDTANGNAIITETII